MATKIQVPPKPKITKVKNSAGQTLQIATWSKPKAPATATANSNATGATIATPSVTATPPPATTNPSFNYADAFYADPRYATGLAGITQTQLGIGQKYGYTLNRDTDKASPTYGMVKYRVPGTKPGTGSITARVDPRTGAMTYSDSSGKTYNAADLELDVIPIARGEDGYLEGQFGQSAAQSEKNQFGIGDTAARSGAGRSGMRASASSSETAALQSALRNLSLGAAGELGGTTTRYADLLNTIYPDLVKQAEAYATPAPEAPAAAAPEMPAAATSPEYSGYNAPGTPSSGALSGGPGGDFMKVIGNVTLERNTNDAGIRQGLRALLNNPAYKLTAQQKAYINSLISGRYKGNKKY